jgi:hypothetical protein
MKRIIYILLLAFCTMVSLQAQTVSIPDDNFLTALRDVLVDANNDGLIQISEAKQVTSLDIDNKDISDLTGIEAFTNLKHLNCSSNMLSTIDLTKNKALEYLDCSFNALETLNVSQNTSLTYLDCGINALKTLDVSLNTSLKELYIFYNDFSSINISKNTALHTFKCDQNKITSLDLSKNTALLYLSCPYNVIIGIDVSKNTLLISIECYSNQISQLDVTQNTALNFLLCQSNQLSSLNVTQNLALKSLICNSNLNLKTICVAEVDSVINNSQFKKDLAAVWSDTCNIQTSVEENYQTPSQASIYPNPTEGIIHLGNEAISATIYNHQGHELMSSNSQTLDLSTQTEGIYFVKVLYKNQKYMVHKITRN